MEAWPGGLCLVSGPSGLGMVALLVSQLPCVSSFYLSLGASKLWDETVSKSDLSISLPLPCGSGFCISVRTKLMYSLCSMEGLWMGTAGVHEQPRQMAPVTSLYLVSVYPEGSW